MSEQICAWLSSQQDAMLALMEKVVNIDSGTYDKAGVDAVGEVFANFSEAKISTLNACRAARPAISFGLAFRDRATRRSS
jgi:hypothetical protein